MTTATRSQVTSAPLLTSPGAGGEFAFVAFGESVARGLLPAALTSQLYLVGVCWSVPQGRSSAPGSVCKAG